MERLEEKIKNAALAAGYEACGIIKVSVMSGFEQKLNERMAMVPAASPFYQNYRGFAHLEESYPWAKSIVICVRNDGKYIVPDGLEGLIGKSYLFDSRTNPLS
ncbi:MAG TPA: hypothetical protein VJ280_02020, partial [Dehalococcoidales bacterium]|nr:hypothetical protein [Dehalococcoidales bacterium]